MRINEHDVNAVTVNGETVYSVTVVYQISEKSKELVAYLTVDVENKNVHVVSLGTERTGSKAGERRVFNLIQYAGNIAIKYDCLCKLEGPNNYFKHMVTRRD